MKAFITGITGMIGSHFYKELSIRGYEVYGIARNSASSRLEQEKYSNIFRCDILDKDFLEKLLEKVHPDLVIHMAAQAFNGMSWDMEYTTHQTNYFGTLNLLQACRKVCPEAKILLACSSAEYGAFEINDCPLKESQPLHPITPYGVSKVATENLGFQYYKNFNLKVFLPRMFIHVGTGHPPATAIQNFARQLALIKLRKMEPIMKVGTLETARDFIDVRDGVSAMLLVLDEGIPGTPVNICTGDAFSIKETLEKLTSISGIDEKIIMESSLFRPSDETTLYGDNSIICSLGWKQKFSFNETLNDVFSDWMKRLS
jgi:GDP-4-dehydro-6-deoxy-D-mannose reductase